MENNFLKFIVNEKNNNINSTHLINISAAISYFPKLTKQIIDEFIDYDKDISDFFDENLKNDGQLRKPLVCSLIFAEKNKKEKLKNILETYLTSVSFKNEIQKQLFETYDKEGYKLASFLLYDYYVYLETGKYNGLVTNI